MDIERNIEFIISQQAQFAADIQFLKENQEALQQNQQALQQNQQAITKQQEAILGNEAATQKDIRSLVDVVASLARLHEALTGTVQDLASRLDTLITVVESHLTGHK